MEIKAIRSLRAFETWPSYHLIYEWEDIISKELKLKIIYESKLHQFLNRVVRKLGINFLFWMRMNKSVQLYFDMTAKTKSDSYNRSNIAPVIVDFFITNDNLKLFIQAYDKTPFLLISSAEVMHFLKENHFPLKYYHYPLSISDKYKITIKTNFNKKWDLVLLGRQNPFLEKCLQKYTQKYTDFVYVYRTLIGNKFMYQTNKGELIGEFSSRESYIELMKQSRIGFYSTPGIDGGEEYTKGFNPVTPRFLELIASGCHIIARYQQNKDTEFFKLSDFCSNIESYKQFEDEMNRCLQSEVSMEKYVSFINDHYTSNRAKILINICKEYKTKL